MWKKRARAACVLGFAALLSACGTTASAVPGKSYTLVDEDGLRAGKVIFSMTGGTGEIYDSRGRLIGRIVEP